MYIEPPHYRNKRLLPLSNPQRWGDDSAECRQDKPPAVRAPTASPQAAPPQKDLRPHQVNSNFSRRQNNSKPKRKTIHTTIHFNPRVHADIKRYAQEHTLSLSAATNIAVEWFLQQSLYAQNAATIDTAMSKSFSRYMRAYSDRQASLQARTLVKLEELYEIGTNILGRQPGVDKDILRDILHKAFDRARARLSIITPQMQSMIDRVKKLFDIGEVKSGG